MEAIMEMIDGIIAWFQSEEAGFDIDFSKFEGFITAIKEFVEKAIKW